MSKVVHGGNLDELSRNFKLNKESLIDFSANINPLGLNKKVKEAIIKALEEVERYPDITYYNLKSAISEFEKVNQDDLILGNGAAEVIFNLVRAVNPKKVLIPAPTFSEYEEASLSVKSSIEYYYLKERGLSIAKYHGGLKDEEKNYYQDEFLKDNFNVMIATNAFGMGIDKSIRTLEYLIYTTAGSTRKEIEIKKLQSMIDFCEYDKCYRSFILEYFGDKNIKPYCNNCSNCLNNDELRDYTTEAQMILSCVYRSREKFGISVLVDVLRGFTGPKIIQNKLNELTTFGIMKEYSSKFIRDLIKTLIDLGYVNLKEGTYSMLKLNPRSIKVLKSQEKVICKLSENIEEKIINKDLFNKLRLWRKDKANSQGIKPYIIFSDSTLMELANKVPQTKEELLSIRGMGEKKYEKYGEELLIFMKINGK